MSGKEKLWRILKRVFILFIFAIPVFYYGGTVREAEAYCSGNKCSGCNGNGYYTTTTTYSGGKMITRFGCNKCGGSGNKIYYYNSSGKLTSTSGSYTAGSGGSHKWSSGTNGNNYRCKEPTCTTNGCWHYKCTYCGTLGATHHETIAALGHNYVNAGNVVQYTSCTNNGYRQYACSRCGGQDGQWHLYEYAWGHSYGDWYAGTDGYYHRDCIRGCGTSEKGEGVQYTISFDGNGSDSGKMSGMSATYGISIMLNTNVYTRKGYSFAGWSKTPDGSAVYSDRQSVSNLTTVSGATVTLYAVWSPDTYTVTLDANGGILEKKEIKVFYDSVYGEELCSPEREGFTFQGWYYGDKKVTGDTTANLAAENHTLVAHWKRNTYEVHYHANGGTFEDGSNEKVLRVLYESEIDLSLTPAKAGRIFLGWSESSDDTVCIMNQTMPAADVDLYAVFSLRVSDIREATLVSWSRTDSSTVNVIPMTMTKQENNGYYYAIEHADTLQGLSYNDLNDVALYILLYDHAGNRTDIPIQLGDVSVPEQEKPPIPDKYLQTIIHYVWNPETKSWVYHATTDELVDAGTLYQPKFLTEEDENYPTGYRPDTIDGEYVVDSEKTSKACYQPIAYQLYFEPNGGSCDTKSKEVYKDYYIGELPVAERAGYDFLGWYTKADGGEKIADSDKYSYDSDITVYAHWDIHKHDITFDYITNGGSGVEKEYWKEIEYGTEVAPANQAWKDDGWSFVGWSMDPSSKEGITGFVMPDQDVVLYAIYSKEVGITFVDYRNEEVISREESGQIYNNETYLEIMTPEQNTKDGWTCLGWAEAGEMKACYSSQVLLQVCDRMTIYGCYEKDVTVSFDTNGSMERIEDIRKKRTFVSSGEEKVPTFTVPNGPGMEEHSFVTWKDQAGDQYTPGETRKILDDIILTAAWDKFPEIEAYDRYFSLSFAQSGGITKEVLFEKVTASDQEDGILENGTDVTIPGYQTTDFTSFTDDGSVSVTYAATDSYGNRVTAMVTVHIVDTADTEPFYQMYIRFIDKKYYMDAEGNYVPASSGGLEPTSKWITDASYAGTLTNVLSYTKEHTEKTFFHLYGKEIELPNPASGEWSHVKSCWVLSKSVINEMQEFVQTNGYGKFKNQNAITDFYTKFGAYRGE